MGEPTGKKGARRLAQADKKTTKWEKLLIYVNSVNCSLKDSHKMAGALSGSSSLVNSSFTNDW